MSYEHLDRQLKAFSNRLVESVGLGEQETGKVATLVAAEVRFLEPASRVEVHAAGPVPLRDRVDELRAFQGLVYWARKGSDPDEALCRFEVSQGDLDFWQALSRGVAYAAYTSIEAV